MMVDKYKKLAKELPDKILSEFGVEVVDMGESVKLETQEGTREEHVARLSGILSVQAALFRQALRLSLAMKPDNEGIDGINYLRISTLALLNKIADGVLENYVDNEITTKRVEVSND